MHDPMSVAFDIRRPWPEKNLPADDDKEWKWYPPIVTVWHVDPEVCGEDSSCQDGYRMAHNPPRERWSDESEEMYGIALRERARYASRIRWYNKRIPWRWHFWHYRIQIHPLRDFKRWAFTRCASCKRRFKWGETGMGNWSGTGPMWFRSEWLQCFDCDGSKKIPKD